VASELAVKLSVEDRSLPGGRLGLEEIDDAIWNVYLADGGIANG
jgi:hypothetical protein